MLRRCTAVSVLVAGTMVPLSGAAFAADQNCSDFTTRQDAQDVYEQDRSDPDGLDRDDDGIACESLDGGSSAADDSASASASASDSDSDSDSDSEGQVAYVPSGGADTGGGSTTTGGDDTALLAGGGAVLAALGLGGWTVARGRARQEV